MRSMALLLALGLAGSAMAAEPIKLHPDNPHYFLFRGQPTVLITSGEHYGAVLNFDFDFVPYLNELQARGFNLTRTFSGTYQEVSSSFGIVENTLAPHPGRYCCPWARSSTPGAGDGGNKFDLTRWNPAYFDRLKEFVSQAGKRGIVVELSLFCTIYDDALWNVNPMKASNNINGLGNGSRREVYTLKDRALTEAQKALARKILSELKDFDNVYYEVCNEPYADNVTREWNDTIIAAVVEAESSFPGKHLIAQNISNGSARIQDPNRHVSIFNFHYAEPPDTVGLNFALNRVMADDETGFKGKGDLAYRSEGWNFLMAGGAVYSNLDYSFTCKRPSGTAVVTTSPGGGGPELRQQLSILKTFMDSLDFLRMTPNVTQGVAVPGSSAQPVRGQPTARALVEVGRTYAVYLQGDRAEGLVLDLPAGSYRAEWINTKTGKVDKKEVFRHAGGQRILAAPAYTEDIALRVKRI